MPRGTLRLFVIAASAAAAACSGASAPSIQLNTANPQQAVVEVSGLSRSDRAALSRVNLTDAEWSAVLRVTVANPGSQQGAAVPPIAGRYVVEDSVRFIPMFPLDPGRRYEVSFDASRVTRPGMPRIPNAHGVVSLPASTAAPSTVVTAVFPSGDVIPENQLRMYVQFSGPMGQQGGLGHIALFDKAGQEITGAMLPLDTELWNGDRTRYTLLFDPGRVKREILPNRAMGRPLHRGQAFSLVVKTDWLDARGVPLKSEFKRQYRVGPPDEKPLSTLGWHIASPPALTRGALTISFPEPLDHALLQRAIGVSHAGAIIPGDVGVETGETRWTFVPRDPWQPGVYTILVQPILEDLAGNRIGRAFEVRSPGDAVAPEPDRPVSLPFRVPMPGAR